MIDASRSAIEPGPDDGPAPDAALAGEDVDRMARQARAAADFLKVLSHEGRLMILCHLCTGEKSVGDLERLLSARQAAVSQQLSRLRLEGLADARRDGKNIYYRLTDDRALQMVSLLHSMFCSTEE